MVNTTDNYAVLNYKGEHAMISGIGIVHGLASNDELLLLLTLSLGISSFLYIFIGLTIFTVGVVLGMLVFSTLLKLPFNKYGREHVVRIVNVSIALLTLTYAFYSLAGGSTINLLPFVSDNFTGALYILALVLGMKHSMDADHVVAISTILLRADSFRKSVTLSISWALGHMLTASVITFILFSFREVILSRILSHFEVLVSIMLILIAVLTLLWEFDVITWGKHTHTDGAHVHEDGTAHTH